MNIHKGTTISNQNTLYKDCSSNYWFEENSLTGIATTTGLVYYTLDGIIPAATIQNANIDCNIP